MIKCVQSYPLILPNFLNFFDSLEERGILPFPTDSLDFERTRLPQVTPSGLGLISRNGLPPWAHSFIRESRENILASPLPQGAKLLLLTTLTGVEAEELTLDDYAEWWLRVHITRFAQTFSGVEDLREFPASRLLVPLRSGPNSSDKASIEDKRFFQFLPGTVYEINIQGRHLTAEEMYFISNFVIISEKLETACRGVVHCVDIEYEEPKRILPGTNNLKAIQRATFRFCSEAMERRILAHFYPHRAVGARFGIGEFAEEEIVEGQKSGEYCVAFPNQPLPWADNLDKPGGLLVSPFFYHIHDRYHRTDQILLDRNQWQALESLRQVFVRLLKEDPHHPLYRCIHKELVDKENYSRLHISACIRKALLAVFIYFSSNPLRDLSPEGLFVGLQIFVSTLRRVSPFRQQVPETLLVERRSKEACYAFLGRLQQIYRSIYPESSPSASHPVLEAIEELRRNLLVPQSLYEMGSLVAGALIFDGNGRYFP